MSTLLAPLAGPSPCGADLSFSPEFDAIQQMLRADDPTLSQGEWVTELKVADWSGAALACEALLQQRTKDLRVVGWLTEAWAQLRGYQGLADGIELAHGLCAGFWNGLHPLPDDGDFELRTGALSRLMTQVAALSAALPVLQRGAVAFALRDLEAARALQASQARARDGGNGADSTGKLTQDEAQKAQRETPPALLAERLMHCRRAREALAALQAVVDAHLGDDGPSFSAAKTALEAAVHAIDRLARPASGTPAPAAAAAPPASNAHTAEAAARSGAPSAPTTRAEALAQLRLVAEFFRRTEPHNPVAYLAERAAQWGELPLHDWLRLVLKDPGALGQLEDLLGVEPKPDGQ